MNVKQDVCDLHCAHCTRQLALLGTPAFEEYMAFCLEAVSRRRGEATPALAAFDAWLDSESADMDDCHAAADYMRYHHGR